MKPEGLAPIQATLAGWGNYPRIECALAHPRYIDELPGLLDRTHSLIARGNGRSYGDAALSPDLAVATRYLNRIRGFDREAGLVTFEAGVLLDDLLEFLVPQGWFVPVVPGTAQVSLGGMAAADVHGKNHHVDGAFGRHVQSMKMLLGNGQVIDCSRREHPELFAATLGGMGLTGIILELTVRLAPIESAWVRQTTQPARNLDEVMALFEASADQPLSVAWLDCLAAGKARGRSLLFCGQVAQPAELPKMYQARPHQIPARSRSWSIPRWTPGGLLSRWSVSAFNRLYYGRHRMGGATRTLPYRDYYFPLDGLADWNRLYGRRGLIQHQCVLPPEASREGLSEILSRTSRAGQGSMLAVLKKFGPGAGPLSFPMPGYTLALDFPVNTETLKLCRELGTIVRAHQGRIYLAKDATSDALTVQSGYPELPAFAEVRATYHGQRFQSALSRRLELT